MAGARDDEGSRAHVLDRLWQSIEARRGADPATSYTASLLAAFPDRPARKLSEEATEVAIEALRRDRSAVARESADLLYHLLVLLAGAGVAPALVWAELARRTSAAAGGKGARRAVSSRKIP